MSFANRISLSSSNIYIAGRDNLGHSVLWISDLDADDTKKIILDTVGEMATNVALQ